LSPKYLYLLLDLGTVSIPLLFSFYPRANFSKKWRYLLPAILVPGIIFLLADEIFTRIGVWGFNPAYLTGLYVGSLPIEEILFFICIPYACVFTYEALKVLVARDYFAPYQRGISTTLIVFALAIGITHITQWYTATTFFALAIYLGWIQLRGKEYFLGRFYFSYLIILIPFFAVNGVLTGSGIEEPVVWYNEAEIIGLRLGTIPIEDAFYGMLLLAMNVGIFEQLQHKE
jgi:lycopene cyclase domain-containing protein